LNQSKVKRSLLSEAGGSRSKSSSPTSSFFQDESPAKIKKGKGSDETQRSSAHKHSGTSFVSDPANQATDEELLDYLNSKETGLDEVSLLKKELMTQGNEMRLMVKNHKKLEKGNS